MARSRKKFDYGEGKYYFTIKSIPNNITMHRDTKEAAQEAYRKYKAIGKTVEWQGRWGGKKFAETTAPSMSK
ncbi:MAG TPA: hypothetical protein ENJ95_09900 [Bacteroidetes bacterium]|nr:hypothetical protein [Bacteroidota bacterium]